MAEHETFHYKTPEELDKMKTLQDEIETLGQSVIDISGRVDKLSQH